MNRNAIVLAVIVLGVVGGMLYFHQYTFPWLGDHWSEVWGAIGTLSSVASLYYFKNERFFLAVQKYLILPFKQRFAKWKFMVRYEQCPMTLSQDKTISMVLQQYRTQITNVFTSRDSDYRVTRSGENYIDIVVGDEISFRFILEPSSSLDSLNIVLATSTFTVPFARYEMQIHQMTNLFERLESAFTPCDRSYQIQASFDNGNPYSGFFVKHIPARFISQFSCSFNVPKDEHTSIKANQQSITIDSDRYSTLQQYALKYFALKDDLAAA